MKPKTKTLLLVLGIVLVLFFLGFYNILKIQRYRIDVEEINHPVRIALIADLHSCQYGENEQQLTQAIEAQNPDILVFAGDIFDDGLSDDNAEALLRGVAEKYPCYYVSLTLPI